MTADLGHDARRGLAALRLAEALEVVAGYEVRDDERDALLVAAEMVDLRRAADLRLDERLEVLEGRARVHDGDLVPERLDDEVLPFLGPDEEGHARAARAQDGVELVAGHVEGLVGVGVRPRGLLEVVDRRAPVLEREHGHEERVLAGAPRLGPGALEGEGLAEVALGPARPEDGEDERAELVGGARVVVARPVAAAEVAPRAPQDVDRRGLGLEEGVRGADDRGDAVALGGLAHGRLDDRRQLAREHGAALEELGLDRLVRVLEAVGDLEEPLAVRDDLPEGGPVVLDPVEEPARLGDAGPLLLVLGGRGAHVLAREPVLVEEVEVARPARVGARDVGEVEDEPVREELSPLRELDDRVLLLEADPVREALADGGRGRRREVVGIRDRLARVEDPLEELVVRGVREPEDHGRGVEGGVVVEEEAVEEVYEEAPLDLGLLGERLADVP